MAAKSLLVICASAVCIQIISGQCIGNAFNTGIIGNGFIPDGFSMGYGSGCGIAGLAPAGLAAASGGGFAVTSASPIAPTGLSIVSENAIEGALTVGGQLPFLSAVALEGAFPTAGAGTISYGCGNGAVGITSEGLGAGPVVTAGPYGAGLAPGPVYGPGPMYGPGMGYNGLGGCGCGAIY